MRIRIPDFLRRLFVEQRKPVASEQGQFKILELKSVLRGTKGADWGFGSDGGEAPHHRQWTDGADVDARFRRP